VLLSAFMVLNLVIGVLCEVVAQVSAEEKEAIAMEGAVQRFAALLSELDADNDGKISKEEFVSMLSHPTTLGMLPSVGLDPNGLFEHVETIFKDGITELEMDDFWEAILKFRKSETATLKDIVDLRKYLTELLGANEVNVTERMTSKMSDLEKASS